ncbi:MAG TPA: DUF1592 domain-containing protein [Pirellulales bacterium]|nr:DUF1592 domain-containing protein [Pirellulales bacterium]
MLNQKSDRWFMGKLLRIFRLALGCALCPFLNAQLAWSADNEPKPEFHQQIEPLLVQYCYECHGFGEKKGQVAFDEFKTDDELLHNPDLWWKVLRNVRSNIMPPAGNLRPTNEEKLLLAQWIKYQGLGINPRDPDPGHVTLRRLNRVEYRNTIRDLMGFDYKTTEEFPADDTGYGFDNISDVLTVSPLLLEKYLKAAETIVAGAVPTEPRSIDEHTIPGNRFHTADEKLNGSRLSFYQPATIAHSFHALHTGTYRVLLDVVVQGNFEFDPGRCRVIFKVDDQQELQEEFGWYDGKKFHFQFEQQLSEGDHPFTLSLEPLTPTSKKINSLDLILTSVQVQGPLEDQYRVKTANYDRFFSRSEPPSSEDERRQYAREVLSKFVKQAYRRPVDDETIERLVTIARSVYSQPDKRFEEGVQRAMVAVLASPRFLFRAEEPDPTHLNDTYPLVDEYALASRLSYFLWSSTPDRELFQLAEQGQLRMNLEKQVLRMIKDPRSEALTQNFVGQWLQVRDVEGTPINEQAVVAREDDELRKLLDTLRNGGPDIDRRSIFRQLRNRPNAVQLNGDIRHAMQQEVEMLFDHIVHEDRSVLDLIDCDYTFLNEKLASYYGLPDVHGNEMRQVALPKDSPRGGVLTTGAVLVVTSNPDRTSPVKRGLFILDNILGSPPPPPPGNVPLLEDSEKGFKDHQPTSREVLELHRSQPLCSSCHTRMDPLGLGLENFNALGRWRDKERGQPIDSTGELLTGEKFESVQDLKHILLTRYREDFYRCLTEKLLTFALGRGLNYDDVDTVDTIVDRLQQENGQFSALLTGIIDSPQFEKRRRAIAVVGQTAQKP